MKRLRAAWKAMRRRRFDWARWLPVTGSIVLMTMVVCVSAVSLVKLKHSMYWRKHTYEVLISAQQMFAHLIDSQRGMRGYVLTGQLEDLRTYRDGVRSLPLQLSELQQLTADNPSQQIRIARLAGDLSEVIGYSRRLLAARDEQSPQAAMNLESTGEGRLVIDRMGADLKAFTDEEHRLLIERDARAQDDFRNTTDLLVIGSLLAAILLVLAHLVANREVNRRRRHQQEMDRLKHEFISTASHELRTPLTSIRGSLGLLEAGVVGELPPQAQSLVKIAHQNSERLVRIVNDILDVEKIESGKLELHMSSIPVASFLRQALEENAAYGEKYLVQFVLESAPENTRVRADADRLMQVLTNLLSNGAKFSAAGAQVYVRARINGPSIRVEVQDHGTGIPQSFRDRVFEKFSQADASSTRRFDGTGLGLSITRQLVEAMGGTIGFTTVSGEGTTFYFDLPADLTASWSAAESSATHSVSC
ncbi:MAG: CHASE3 domain-containing protein [Sinobacteraceae bacterium]|nr:CHASE3 domain-containing protein [Nevskiaceae bacterium]